VQYAVASAGRAAASHVSAPAILERASVILDDMKEQVGSLVSVHSGDNEDLSKDERVSVKVELDGFVGDKHRGFERVAWPGDKDPAGTVRRNERQWSGVSVEELAIISQKMDLKESLTAEALGANICVEGIPDFSRLPGGTRLLFSSGAVLAVEEGNPPCADMGVQITARYTTLSGEQAAGHLFPSRAFGLRGVVGVVDVPGVIRAGDKVVVQIHEPPVEG
jgi:MOSC domain-containing protein YiiM